MCGQSWIWVCHLAMPGDGEYCPWFSLAYPVLGLVGHFT